jgi:hypothetical protein
MKRAAVASERESGPAGASPTREDRARQARCCNGAAPYASGRVGRSDRTGAAGGGALRWPARCRALVCGTKPQRACAMRSRGETGPAGTAGSRADRRQGRRRGQDACLGQDGGGGLTDRTRCRASGPADVVLSWRRQRRVSGRQGRDGATTADHKTTSPPGSACRQHPGSAVPSGGPRGPSRVNELAHRTTATMALPGLPGGDWHQHSAKWATKCKPRISQQDGLGCSAPASVPRGRWSHLRPLTGDSVVAS